MDDEILFKKPKNLTKFKVVGLIPHPDFQKCRFLVEKLYVSLPDEFAKPEIRAMLNLDWDEFLTKMRRRHGKPFWLLQVPVAVYMNGTFLGDHKALSSHIAKSYVLEPNLDFEEMGKQELIKYFTNVNENLKRKFVYLTIAIDKHIVGSMLFQLYNDLVPITCTNFLSRCNAEDGYKGTPVHRIARYSWVQCGGWKLKHIHMPCENYTIPHDRRGVLSMCNKRRHEDNSTQFYITLEPASWMDYNYVAFGQLVQGAEILNSIEKVSTYYQNPLRKILIVDCGEFSLCPQPDEEYVKSLLPPYAALFEEVKSEEDKDSVLSWTGLKSRKYYLKTDVRPYLGFTRYSKMFEVYLKELQYSFPQVEAVEAEIKAEAVRLEKLAQMQAEKEGAKEIGDDHEEVVLAVDGQKVSANADEIFGYKPSKQSSLTLEKQIVNTSRTFYYTSRSKVV